jgi:L-alanine-DL-glutamate epimerase-like enolase superfamily enzyme
VDLALWDIRGQVEGEPVHRLLNGGGRESIRAYAAGLFQPTPEATADRAREALEAGFTAVKFGWEPFGEEPERECAFLEAIRREIGDDVELMLDAGHAWDAATTLERARLFEPYGLLWIEEPLHPDDLGGYAEVSRECEIPIAAGEEECTVAGFDRLMELGSVDVVQVDPARVGLTQGLTVAMLAQSSGIPIVNHTFTTDINVAASLHLLASVPNAFILEYGAEPGGSRHSLVRNPIQIVDGHARVPAGPGLGVEPDPILIEKYLVRD